MRAQNCFPSKEQFPRPPAILLGRRGPRSLLLTRRLAPLVAPLVASHRRGGDFDLGARSRVDRGNLQLAQPLAALRELGAQTIDAPAKRVTMRK